MKKKSYSECSYDNENEIICSSQETIKKMEEFIEQKVGKKAPKNKKLLLDELNKLLGTDSESEILSNKEFCSYIGHEKCKYEKETMMLPLKPNGKNGLVDNDQIDKSLGQLVRKFNGLHKKNKSPFNPFFIPFQMIDFDIMNTELSEVDLKELKEVGYNCFGVILNTDISSGPGQHWFCIFWDGTTKGTKDDPWILEFFNSSGNLPVPEVENWLHKMEAQLAKQGIHLKTKIVLNFELQKDKHSCGIYCIAYIYHRLHGGSIDDFVSGEANDNFMDSFRKKIFRKN
jgi:hypothetical protein